MPLELKNPDDPSFNEELPKEKVPLDMGRILTFIAVGVLLLSLGGAFWAGWHYSTVAVGGEAEAAGIAGEVQVLDVQIQKEREKNSVNVGVKQNKITELTTYPSRIPWSDVLAELERATHEATENSNVAAIFSYTAYSAQSNGTITVTGYTNSYSAIADLIESLEDSELFKDVKFSSSSKNKESIATLNLTFNLDLKAPESDVPEKTTPQQ